jgi:hypothetical protein
MGPVCQILASSIARPNPFSFGGAGNDRFDQRQPGIVRWSPHPLLLALALWAAAHVVPNGDQAHVILFGTFTAFAILGDRLIDRRKRREIWAEWQRLRAAVAGAPILSRRASGAPWPGSWPVLRSMARFLGCIQCSSVSARFPDRHYSMSSIQVFAATARGSPSGPMASIAT